MEREGGREGGRGEKRGRASSSLVTVTDYVKGYC